MNRSLKANATELRSGLHKLSGARRGTCCTRPVTRGATTLRRMDQLGHRVTVGPNPLRKSRRAAGAGGRGRSDNVSLCAGASGVTGAWASGTSPLIVTRDVVAWRSGPCPRQPACLTRTSMPRYRMTPSRSRPRPGLGIAERCASRDQGAKAKARGANPILLRSAPLPERSCGLMVDCQLPSEICPQP